MRRWLRAILLLTALAAGPVTASPPLQFDLAHSRLGFQIRTRLGQRLEGEFPRFEGSIRVLADGRHQVQLRMFSEYVQIPDKPRYSGWMRGEDFFDAGRYPVVEFESDPYPADTARQGGDIEGRLTIRGISRREVLHLEKPECATPGYDCDLVSQGTISRGRYGMDRWQFAVSDRVTFILRARLDGASRP